VVFSEKEGLSRMEEMNGANLKNQAGSALRIIALLIVVACLALFPFVFTNRFYISLVNEMMIYGLLAMSWMCFWDIPGCFPSCTMPT
jgi:hypothetical protein